MTLDRSNLLYRLCVIMSMAQGITREANPIAAYMRDELAKLVAHADEEAPAMPATTLTAEERAQLLHQFIRSIYTVTGRACSDYEARIHVELLAQRALGIPTDKAELELKRLDAAEGAAPTLFCEDSPPFKATGMLARAFVESDPVIGTPEFNLYYDDGAGNGDHLFSLPLEELERAVHRWRMRRGL